MAAKTKNHFVPKFYLRAFGSSERQISLYNFKGDRFVHGAALKNQSYSSKFYGDDSTTEDALAKLEGVLAPQLASVRTTRIPGAPGTDADQALRWFIALQHLRTPAAAALVNAQTDKMMKQIFGTRHGLSEEVMSTGRFGYDNPIVLSLSALGGFYDSTEGLVACVATSNGQFITSDTAVFLYNQWCQKSVLAAAGPACSGVQIFLPLSPTTTVVYYDPEVYELNRLKAKGNTIALAPVDIERLNRIQIVAAHDHLYFSSVDAEERVRALVDAGRHLRVHDPVVVEEYADSDRPRDSLLRVARRLPDLSLQLDFLKVRKRAARVELMSRLHAYRDVPVASYHSDRRTAPMGGTRRFSALIGRR